MLFLSVALLTVSLTAAQQTCSVAGSIGPCFNGQCPAGANCINPGTPNEGCCTDPPPPPTTAPPPTTPFVPPPVTTTAAAPITVVTVPTTVGSGTTCVDQLNPNTGVSDCPKMVSYCNNAAYYTLMTQQCPKTCGRCTSTGTATTSSTCVDKLNPNTGVSDCPGMVSYCNDANYYSLMTTQCPKTCGRCSGSTGTSVTSTTSCVDLVNPSTGVSDCPSKASLCNNTSYYTFMTQQCPKTCGRCTSSTGVTTSTTTCVDQKNPNTGVSDCPGMVSYCNNAAYSTLMTQQCPLTCGRCTGK